MTAPSGDARRELEDAHARGARARPLEPDAPQWQRTLALRVAAHDLVVAGDRLLGRVSAQHEPARLAVVDAIDAAIAAGVSAEDVDAVLARIRATT